MTFIGQEYSANGSSLNMTVKRFLSNVSFSFERCSSKFGRRKDLEWTGQVINLAPRCFSRGPVAHEIMHSFGFLHEQQRNDRDKYVKINWQNVISGMLKVNLGGFSYCLSAGLYFRVPNDHPPPPAPGY